MDEKTTVRQLAQRKGANPHFLLRKLQQLGLSYRGLDDTINNADTQRVLQSIARPRQTLSKKGKHEQQGGRPEAKGQKGNKGQKGQKHNSGAPHKNKAKQQDKRAGQPGQKTGQQDKRAGQPGQKGGPQDKRGGQPGQKAGPPRAKQPAGKGAAGAAKPQHKKEARGEPKDKKSKGKGGGGDARQEKAAQRYGVQISEEDAIEIARVVKEQKVRDLSSNLRAAQAERRAAVKIDNPHKFVRPNRAAAKSIVISGDLPFAELARKLAIKKTQLFGRLKRMNLIEEGATDELVIDKEMAVLVSEELGYEVIQRESQQDAYAQSLALPPNTIMAPRAPIVTIMGHVDHGKTTLLDYIRKSKEAESEAGQITQHFGAYSVALKDSKITFFDTPGHAAFSEMRARGARLTDIVVIVVAADDGMKPQTVEAINHARSARAEIVVAINKTDLETADPEQVRKDLAGQGLQPEEWGGEVQFVEISAKSGAGVDKLLAAISAQASIMELRAGVGVPGRGYVIESKLDKALGPAATIILQHGEIKRGDILVAGDHYGRIKLIRDDMGEQVKLAAAGVPVNILGLGGVPSAGDKCLAVKNEKEARKLIEFNRQRQEAPAVPPEQVDLEKLLSAAEEERQQINLIIKTDVAGSLEAIKGMINALGAREETKVDFSLVATGVGAVSESDVGLARATQAIIVGFNVRLDARAKQDMKRAPAPEVHYYNVIYDLADQLDKLIKENAALQDTEKVLGIALVKEVFSAKQYGQIAGCEVTEGVVRKDKPIRVLRDNKVIYEGVLESLRRFKENVEQVQQGVECGIGVKDYKNVKVGDQIEVFDRLDGPS